MNLLPHPRLNLRALLLTAMVGSLVVLPPACRAAQAPKETPAMAAARADRLAQEAEALAERGKAKEAAALFQQAAELVPDDRSAWERAGWGHLDARDAPAAVRAFDRAEKAGGMGAAPSGGMAIARFAARQKDELAAVLRRLLPAEAATTAVTVAEKGLAARDFTTEWNYALGYLLFHVVRNSQRALGPLEAVIGADPKRADAWLLLVEANQDLGQGAQEDAAAVEYLKLAPETADAFRLRAQRYTANGQLREAAEEYRQGISRYPTVDVLHYQLARVHERLGQAREAEEVYRGLIGVAEKEKREGTAVLARTQLAQFFGRRGNHPEAEKLFRELAERKDASLLSVENWGHSLVMTGKWPEAARAFATAAQRTAAERGGADNVSRDSVVQAYLRSALAHLAAGARNEARTALETGLKSRGTARTTPETESATLLSWLGGKPEPSPVAYVRGDERWANFTWRSLPPDDELEVRGRFSLGVVAHHTLLEQVVKSVPGCWPAEYSLARLQASRGLTDVAIGHLRRVIQAQPEWWAPQFALGQHYTRQRDREKGEPALRQVLKLAPDCRQARVYLSTLLNTREDPD